MHMISMCARFYDIEVLLATVQDVTAMKTSYLQKKTLRGGVLFITVLKNPSGIIDLIVGYQI